MNSTSGIVWAAGFIDGEGCITFSSNHTLSLRATQMDTRPLNTLQDLFGGKSYPSSSGAWQWTLLGQPALDAIRGMRPYLLVKGEQADVALEWGAQPWRQLGVLAGKRKRKTDEQKQVDDMLASLCKHLKRSYS